LPKDFAQGLLAGSVYQGNDMTMKNTFPKILVTIIVGWFAVSAQAQQDLPRRIVQPNDARITIDPVTGAPRAARQETRFDLNFKGGTPRQFIEAINLQSGLKVNVIIPSEEAAAQLPAIEVSGVTIPHLFEALTQASRKETNVVTSYYAGPMGGAVPQFTKQWTSQGFRTSDNPPAEDSIWHFYVERPIPPPELATKARVSVQVFQLAPLLKDHSIDDITTAVKTTWQMLDSSVTPELKYHSDTGLLIAKGTADQLRMVVDVLAQVGQSGKNAKADSARPIPRAPTAGQP
jgi:hypothetical protein